jgi:pimeloyl-ACP methyl ester carboxylesterase
MSRMSVRHKNRLACGVVIVVVSVLTGCGTIPVKTQTNCQDALTAADVSQGKSRVVFSERLVRGYTIVLPGIWGSQAVDYGIVMGLQDADVPSAVELHDWTAGPLHLVYNLRAIEHNKGEARKIAAKIVAYQDRHPGKPVHLVGYSGGAGMAVLTLEALPADRQVTDAILLAPTLASDYDLRPAISRTTRGIRNFYSPLDVPILMVLSTAFGTTEGRHTAAAGAVGFQSPGNSTSDERRDYEKSVPQQIYTVGMLMDGHGGGHFGWANRTFVARHVAPLLAAPVEQQPASATASAGDEQRAPLVCLQNDQVGTR